ncbi:hypothetical protein J3A83DRAFT_4374582 [Scleroderma citrinum]
MASSVPPSTVDHSPQLLSTSHSNQAIALLKSMLRATATHPQPPSCSTQAKHTSKCAQDSSAGSDADNPADHAIHFNKKKDQTVQGDAKPYAWHKKDIHGVITNFLFGQDARYGGKYAVNPGKFAVVVNTHLTNLKTKYHQQASKFKSTGEGINPNDLKHNNLLEQVIADYDVKLFNVTPGVNCMGEFLLIIKHGGSTTTPIDIGQQDELGNHQDNTMGEEHLGVGPQDQPIDHVAADKQLAFGDHGEVTCKHQLIMSNVATPSSNSMKAHTPSMDNHSAFWMSPYPRSVSIFLSSTSSTPTTSSQHYITDTSQTSTIKGINMLAQIKANLEEIAHLEVENEKQCAEAERIHHCMIEGKKMDIEVLKEESKDLHLKLELAKVQSAGGMPSSITTSSDFPTLLTIALN